MSCTKLLIHMKNGVQDCQQLVSTVGCVRSVDGTFYASSIQHHKGHLEHNRLSFPAFHQVMSRHSWKDQAAQPKVKYFTQVKARPPTFVAFLSGKKELSETDIRFLKRSLKEDFDLGGIPIRIMQRSVERKAANSTSKSGQITSRPAERMSSDKRSSVSVEVE